MASRNLLYYDDGDLKEMTSAEMVEIQNRMIYAYSQAITAVLTQVSGSGANIDAMSDTRKQAGATSQSSTAFVAEGTTAEPGTVTVAYDKINLAYTTSGIGQTTDTGTTSTTTRTPQIKLPKVDKPKVVPGLGTKASARGNVSDVLRAQNQAARIKKRKDASDRRQDRKDKRLDARLDRRQQRLNKRIGGQTSTPGTNRNLLDTNINNMRGFAQNNKSGIKKNWKKPGYKNA